MRSLSSNPGIPSRSSSPLLIFPRVVATGAGWRGATACVGTCCCDSMPHLVCPHDNLHKAGRVQAAVQLWSLVIGHIVVQTCGQLVGSQLLQYYSTSRSFTSPLQRIIARLVLRQAPILMAVCVPMSVASSAQPSERRSSSPSWGGECAVRPGGHQTLPCLPLPYVCCCRLLCCGLMFLTLHTRCAYIHVGGDSQCLVWIGRACASV
jgi:hypothetical protein